MKRKLLNEQLSLWDTESAVIEPVQLSLVAPGSALLSGERRGGRLRGRMRTA